MPHHYRLGDVAGVEISHGTGKQRPNCTTRLVLKSGDRLTLLSHGSCSQQRWAAELIERFLGLS